MVARVSRSVRVLLVEDNEGDAELLRQRLSWSDLDADLTRVQTLSEMIHALEGKSWDVVVCDYHLPAFDARDALAWVAEHYPTLPFIVLSGHLREDLVVEVMNLGARDFVGKDELYRLAPAIERELGVARLTLELKWTRECMNDLVLHDYLTGLPNYEHLQRHLDSLASSPEPEPTGLFLLDVRRFRRVINSLAQEEGKQLVQEVARRLMLVAGAKGFVARTSQDGFALVVPGIAQESEAKDFANQLHGIMGRPVRVGNYEVTIPCIVGSSLFPEHGTTAEQLFRNALSALYRARTAGWFGFCHYQPELGAVGERQVILESALNRALRQEEFVLHYQPQVDFASGRLIGMEALLRWQHPEYGLVPPNEFIPLLEETGLIIPVGAWVLRTACHQLADWLARDLPPARMAINLSVLQFRDPNLIGVVKDALDGAGVDPALIELEITENMVMHGEEETLAILDQLHGLGVRIGVDDFGSGYSSLSYLKRFPIDTLKIDRSFVKDIGKDETDNAIVNAIVVMGHSLGLAVVAEGVETREQAMALESFGCDIQQGYLHGRPMSPEAFAERLAVGQLTILEEWMGEFSYRAADHHGPHRPLVGPSQEAGGHPAGRPTAP